MNLLDRFVLRHRLKTSPILRQKRSDVDLREIDKRICISTTHRFVLIRIPKCANSTVLKTFLTYDPEYERVREVTYSSRRAKRRTYPKPSDLSPRIQRVALESYSFVTFVRDPFARLASAYLDKIVKGKSEKRLVDDALHKSSDETITFEEFVDYIENGGLYTNPHWAPQVSCLPVEIQRIDLLGRVESLSEDLKSCIETIFREELNSIESLDGHATNAGKRLSEFYRTRELVDRVGKLYENDFAQLGYPAQSHWESSY